MASVVCLIIALIARKTLAGPISERTYPTVPYYPPAAECTEYVVPVTVTDVEVPVFNLPRWDDDFGFQDFLQNLTSRSSPKSINPFAGTQKVTASYKIAASFCTPNDKTARKKTVIVATHGIGPGRGQFNPVYKPEKYNFVQHAIAKGYSVWFYDRLGAGTSSVVSGYENQTPLQSSVLVEILKLVKAGQYTGSLGKPDKLVGLGFSLGALITNQAVEKAVDLFDGVVFSGLNYNTSAINSNGLLRSFAMRIASKQNPTRFGALDNGCLTWVDQDAQVGVYYKYPYYDRKIVDYGEATKEAFAIGEFLSLDVSSVTSGGFTGPVLSVLGAEDYIICDGNCEGVSDEPANTIWKDAKFKTIIQPNAGHNFYYQDNAVAAFTGITDYLASYDL